MASIYGMRRSFILEQWKRAASNAGLATGTAEAQAKIMECAAREVAARLANAGATSHGATRLDHVLEDEV